MKGKQAAAAANRRAEAAHQIIDRLTTELADTKMRAKEAERRAARLEGIEAMIKTADVKRDAEVQRLAKSVEWWREVAKEDGERRRAAMRDLGKICDDIGKGKLCPADKIEFVALRYPHLLAALAAEPVDTVKRWTTPTVFRGTSMEAAERRIKRDQGPESLAKMQRLCGLRATWAGAGKSSAEVINDSLDAQQVSFSLEETMEYVFGTKSDVSVDDDLAGEETAQ